MKHKKILFVCVGNTCRSPMAEAVLKAELKKRKIKWYTVRSAGLLVAKGSLLNPESAFVLQERGIPLPNFTPRQLTEKMMEEADVVICMTQEQSYKLRSYKSRKYRNVTSTHRLFGCDILDPYGRGTDAYREVLTTLQKGIPQLMERLNIKNPPKVNSAKGE